VYKKDQTQNYDLEDHPIVHTHIYDE